MTDFPNTGSLPITIWTGSKYGLGVGSRGVAGGSGPYVSTAWTSANLAFYTPMYLPFRYPVKNLFVYNFATINGNVDVGIYNEDLVLLASTGSTAQAGATALQFFAKEIMLDPGAYYFAMSSNSTTATYAANVSINQTKARYLGMFQQASAFPLPATATPAANSAARIPLVGATFIGGTPNF